MKLSDLFSTIPDDELKVIHEDIADGFLPKQLPDFDPRYSKIVGTMDGHDVWASRFYPGHHVFAFRTNEEVLAYIVIRDQLHIGAHPLTQVWSRQTKDTAGMATALVLFLLRKLQFKLIVTSDELLTPWGQTFLIRNIDRNIFKAQDATTHAAVTGEEVKRNLANVKQTKEPSDMAIILEGWRIKYPLYGTGYRQLPELTLAIGSPDLE